MWFLPNSLLDGNNPFKTKDIFYPLGASLGFHTYIPLVSLLSWPIQQLIGLEKTFTVVTLLGPILSGIGTYFLALYLVKNRWAAFFAGAAYLMLPDRVLRMQGHVNLNQTYMLPFVLLFLLKFYEKPSRRNAVVLGGLLGLSLTIESIFTAFLIIAALVVALWRWRETFTRPFLIGWVQAGAAALLFALPVLVPMLQDLRAHQLDPIPGWGGAGEGSADLFSYFIPSQFNPVTGSWFADVYSKVTAGEQFAFAGWLVLLLAAVGAIFWKHRDKRTLVVLTIVFFLLSLGPVLHIANRSGGLFEYDGIRFTIPLPFVVIHFIPILNGVRIPARFEFFTNLLFVLLAAGGLTYLLNKLSSLKRERWIPFVAIGALLIATVEFLPGNIPATTKPGVPEPYSVIAKDPGNKAVLELPLQWRDGFGRIGDSVANRDDTIFMYYATKHEKPLVNGMTARYPNAREEQLKSIPAFAQILALQGEGSAPPTFKPADLQALGIGYVVAHRDRKIDALYDYISSLGMPVMADDGNTIVWKV